MPYRSDIVKQESTDPRPDKTGQDLTRPDQTGPDQIRPYTGPGWIGPDQTRPDPRPNHSCPDQTTTTGTTKTKTFSTKNLLDNKYQQTKKKFKTKTQNFLIVMKLKNFSCDETQKLKL